MDPQHRLETSEVLQFISIEQGIFASVSYADFSSREVDDTFIVYTSYAKFEATT